MTDTEKSATDTTAKAKSYDGFTEEERAAMKERAQELKSSARRGAGSKKTDGTREVLEKIAEMAEPDRVIAERLHEIITTNAPMLTPKTWYGMPSYAKNGKIVCFFQPAAKFKTRYATLGFDNAANLDDGDMWATSYAVTKLTPAVEAQITDLVKRAAS